MELRPRRGRSAGAPSTPSNPKPSSLQADRSASRRKSIAMLASPVFILSDDETAEDRDSHDELAVSTASLKENIDKNPLIEPPLSDSVKSRRKGLLSPIRSEKKALSTLKKKVAEARATALRDNKASDSNFRADEDDVDEGEGVCVDSSAAVLENPTVEDDSALKTVTYDVQENENLISRGRQASARKCKNRQSEKKKNFTSSDDNIKGFSETTPSTEKAHAVRKQKVHRFDAEDPSREGPSPAAGDNDTSLQIPLDDEMASSSMNMILDVHESSTLKEDGRMQAPKAVSNVMSSSKIENLNEENLNRKLFQENTGCATCSNEHCSAQSNENSKKVYHYSELGNEKLGKVMEADGKVGAGNDWSVTGISEELEHKNSFSEKAKVEIRRGLGNPLEGELVEENASALHGEKHNDSDDGNDIEAPSSSDEDKDELALLFASSMKAYLHNCAPSNFDKSGTMPTAQDLQKWEKSLPSRDEMKSSRVNDIDARVAGHSLSWSPKVGLSALNKSCIQQVGSLKARLTSIWERDRNLQDGLCVPPVDPVKLNKLARKQKKDTIGDKWYNMSAPTITPDLKKELQLVKLRGVLDPKRHYKAEDSKGLPKYFQVGSVVGGPADFYSGRLTKKEQKNSLANELLSDSSLSAYRKRKYLEIQNHKQAGGKGFMKQKKKKRTPAWANI